MASRATEPSLTSMGLAVAEIPLRPCELLVYNIRCDNSNDLQWLPKRALEEPRPRGVTCNGLLLLLLSSCDETRWPCSRHCAARCLRASAPASFPGIGSTSLTASIATISSAGGGSWQPPAHTIRIKPPNPATKSENNASGYSRERPVGETITTTLTPALHTPSL